MSSMSSSVGGWSPGKSISGRVGSVLMRGPLGSRWRGSVRGEDVDDEHQGVGAGDLRRAAGGAVALGRRDDEQHPAAHLLPHEAVVPALDDLSLPDDEVEGGLL